MIIAVYRAKERGRKNDDGSRRRSPDVIKDYVHPVGRDVTLARLFSMVDHRRAVHQAELGKDQPWPTIPMASPSQQVSEERKPIGDLQPRSTPAVEAIAQLRRIERALTK